MNDTAPWPLEWKIGTPMPEFFLMPNRGGVIVYLKRLPVRWPAVMLEPFASPRAGSPKLLRMTFFFLN